MPPEVKEAAEQFKGMMQDSDEGYDFETATPKEALRRRVFRSDKSRVKKSEDSEPFAF